MAVLGPTRSALCWELKPTHVRVAPDVSVLASRSLFGALVDHTVACSWLCVALQGCGQALGTRCMCLTRADGRVGDPGAVDQLRACMCRPWQQLMPPPQQRELRRKQCSASRSCSWTKGWVIGRGVVGWGEVGVGWEGLEERMGREVSTTHWSLVVLTWPCLILSTQYNS